MGKYIKEELKLWNRQQKHINNIIHYENKGTK